LPDGILAYQKIPALVSFWRPRNARFGNIVWPVWNFQDHLVYIYYDCSVYFMTIWCIL
jgi:hypothetical protein